MTLLINIALGVMLTLVLFYTYKYYVGLKNLRKENAKLLALKAAAVEHGYRRLDLAMNAHEIGSKKAEPYVWN